MKIIVAPNSFRGSLTAPRAANCISEGVKQVLPEASIIEIPIADGGEGTAELLVNVTGGTLVEEEVLDPLGSPRKAKFGILGDGEAAVVEMAAASGIGLIPKEKLNPMLATTYGTGQLIRASLEHGCKKIIVGLGGSATVDGGAGMAQALGAKLLDEHGDQVKLGARGLADLEEIDTSELDSRLSEVEIIVACDVENVLVGPEGAAHIFAPQKGATEEMVKKLDEYLLHYANIIERDLGQRIVLVPMGGASGGLAAGLLAFLNARLELGINVIMDIMGMEEHLRDADLVITGEGKIDGQTVYGKAPLGVARLAKKYGVPVVAIVGCIADDASLVYDHGIDGLMSIIKCSITLDESMERASELTRDAAERMMRLIRIGLGLKCNDTRQ